jgi:hypothetical protein
MTDTRNPLHIEIVGLLDDVRTFKAENERLFEENGKLANTLGAENLQLRAEIERLRDGLMEIIWHDKTTPAAAIARQLLGHTAGG